MIPSKIVYTKRTLKKHNSTKAQILPMILTILKPLDKQFLMRGESLDSDIHDIPCDYALCILTKMIKKSKPQNLLFSNYLRGYFIVFYWLFGKYARRIWSYIFATVLLLTKPPLPASGLLFVPPRFPVQRPSY